MSKMGVSCLWRVSTWRVGTYWSQYLQGVFFLWTYEHSIYVIEVEAAERDVGGELEQRVIMPNGVSLRQITFCDGRETSSCSLLHANEKVPMGPESPSPVPQPVRAVAQHTSTVTAASFR